MCWSTLGKCTISVVGLKFWSPVTVTTLTTRIMKIPVKTQQIYSLILNYMFLHMYLRIREYFFLCILAGLIIIPNCRKAQWGRILIKNLNNCCWVIFDNAHKEKLICGLLYNLVSIPDCATPNARKTDAWWTGKCVLGSSLGLIAALAQRLPAVTEGKPVKLQAG